MNRKVSNKSKPKDREKSTDARCGQEAEVNTSMAQNGRSESKDQPHKTSGSSAKRNLKNQTKASQSAKNANTQANNAQEVGNANGESQTGHSAVAQENVVESKSQCKLIQTTNRTLDKSNEEVKGDKTKIDGDTNAQGITQKRIRSEAKANKIPTTISNIEKESPESDDDDDGDSSYELEDPSFLANAPIKSCIKPAKRFRSNASSSVEMPPTVKKRVLDDAPAVVKQLIDAAAKRFAEPLLSEVTDLIIKGYQESDSKKVDKLTQLWIDSIIKGNYTQALMAPASDPIKEKIQGMTALDHLQVIMTEVQSNRQIDSTRSYLIAGFVKHAPKVAYEQVKSLQRFASAETNQFLANVLTGLFSQNKDDLREAHIVIALAMNAAEVVIQTMKETEFADELYNWRWTTLVPFTRRRGAVPNEFQQYVWGAFAVMYPNLSPMTLKLVFKAPNLLGNHAAIKALHEIEQTQQLTVCDAVFNCISDGPNLHESIPMIANFFSRSSFSQALLQFVKGDQLYGHVTALDFVNLLQSLLPMPHCECSKLFQCSKSLSEIIAKIGKEKKARTSVGVDVNRLHQAVCSVLEERPELDETYSKVVTISMTMENTEFATYKHNEYQCLMATQILTTDDKFKAVMLGPGQGKTFVMFLVAHYLLQEDKVPRVYLASTKELVYRQLQDDIRLHPAPKGRVFPIHVDVWRKFPEDGIIILDEGDLFLKDMMLVFQGNELGGLASIRDRNVIIFTATITNYWQNVIKSVFQTSDTSIFHFRDAISMAGTDRPSVLIRGKVVQEYQPAINEMAQMAATKGINSPVIAFTTQNEAQVTYKLQTACSEKGIYFTKIENVSDALTQRELSKNLTSGVWLVDRQFGRGFDLKLGSDSIVLIFDPIRDILLTEAKQMIGRSSRSLGCSQGFIWLVGGSIPADTIPIEHILQEKERRQSDDGPSILAAVLKVWDEEPSERQRLIKMFSKGGWQTDTSKLLQKTNYADLAQKVISRMD